MRSKLLKQFSLSLGLLHASSALAAVTFVPYGVPNAVVDVGNGASVYYLDVSYAGQGAPTYATHDFNGGEVFNFTISGADAAQQYLWVFAEDASSSSIFYPIALASCTAGAYATTGRCDSGVVTDFQIGINFAAVCSGVNGTSIRGCTTGGAVGTAAVPIKAFRLRVLSSTSSRPADATVANGTLLQVYPQVAAPHLLTNIPSPGFFPGDSSILIETNGITVEADPSTGSSPSFPLVWVVAEKGGTVGTGSEMTATLRQTAPYTSGQQEITGFENSTSDAPIFYEMAVGVQDSAGAVVFGNHFTQVFATDIQGFLKGSNCFVATASYRDGRAPGVALLRTFRDQVLSEYKLGRDFIGWYYTYGPIAADWLIEHPVFRSVFLMLLMPLQAFAWIALHPMILFIPLLGLLFIGFLLFRERGEHV